MANERTFAITSQPGIRRDGTTLDSDTYNDGQWCRFVRINGRPKKMGGMQNVSAFHAISRGAFGWSRNGLLALLSFMNGFIEQAYIDPNGGGSSAVDRSANGSIFFTGGGGFRSDTGTDIVYQVDAMFDAAAGSNRTLIFAHPGANLVNIDNDAATSIYFGVANDTTDFTRINNLRVSGGLVCIPPYFVAYGSDGLVSWSNQNEPFTIKIKTDADGSPTVGDAGTARITGSKIVKGLPLRGSGQSPAALLWSLDSVYRMYYIGGQAVFKFDPVSSQSSVLSSSSFIEYDGKFYWIGVDRFLMYNGAVQELPNAFNLDWFFDNLNYAQRQKVWATKITRYGEIWWHFPKGDSTECNHAIVYNTRLNCWYDTPIERSAGIFPQVFNRPIWFETNNAGESKAWVHEIGTDMVDGALSLAVPSFFETSNFGLPTGGSDSQKSIGVDRWTRIERIEPDFTMSGEMTVTVTGSNFAQSVVSNGPLFTFDENTGKIDCRDQKREIRLRFTSNVAGGDYEAGKILMHLEPGDARS